MIKTKFFNLKEGELIVIGAKGWNFFPLAKSIIKEITEQQKRCMLFQTNSTEYMACNRDIIFGFHTNIYEMIDQHLNEFDVLFIDHLNTNATYNLNEVLRKLKANPKLKSKTLIIGVKQYVKVLNGDAPNIEGFDNCKNTILEVANKIYFWIEEYESGRIYTLKDYKTNKTLGRWKTDKLIYEPDNYLEYIVTAKKLPEKL